MPRKMKDGRLGEESTAQPGLLSDPKCFNSMGFIMFICFLIFQCFMF
jgi:hypothetical protein